MSLGTWPHYCILFMAVALILYRFEVGDFVVKFGLVSTGGSVRGILVGSFEYLPMSADLKYSLNTY